MKLFEYLDLPKIPEELISDIYESIKTNPNLFQYKDYPHYKIHQATEKINNFTKTIFDFPHGARVQVIRNNIKIHTDYNRIIAHNYIIDPGGDNVYTCFYNKDGSILEQHKIEPFRWHRLIVSTPHNVIGINDDQLRIAVTVF